MVNVTSGIFLLWILSPEINMHVRPEKRSKLSSGTRPSIRDTPVTGMKNASLYSNSEETIRSSRPRREIYVT